MMLCVCLLCLFWGNLMAITYYCLLVSHSLWDYKLNSTILPSQVKFLKTHSEAQGKIFCSFVSQCVVAYIISYIETHINKKERKSRRKDGKKRGKNTGFKGIRNNKITLTVFIMDACFCKYSRNRIALRVTGCGQALFCCLSTFSQKFLEQGEYQHPCLNFQIYIISRQGQILQWHWQMLPKDSIPC